MYAVRMLREKVEEIRKVLQMNRLDDEAPPEIKGRLADQQRENEMLKKRVREIRDIFESRGFAPGTVRVWKRGDHQKQLSGRWTPTAQAFTTALPSIVPKG